METKNTGLYILILTAGIIIISSLVEIMFTQKVLIEEEPRGYCVVIEPYDTYTTQIIKDSLNPKQQEIVAQGKELFEGNCAMCHAVNQKVVGPALAGIGNRWQSEEQLIEFIKYPEQTMQKNEYAKSLFKEYGNNMMPNHDFFEDEQIKSILLYVRYMSGEKVYVEL